MHRKCLTEEIEKSGFDFNRQCKLLKLSTSEKVEVKSIIYKNL